MDNFKPVGFEPAELSKRHLNEHTCKLWEYGIGNYNGQPVQITNYRSPDGSTITGQKVRFANKDFVFLGDMKASGLYGQWKWRDGGKMVIVVEGELDALSVSQVQDHKWAVVSVPNGASGAKKAIQKQLEWLEKFEMVVLMLDMDEPGQKAAAECAELFTPGKARVAKLPLKDANDMLKAGRGPEIVKAAWDARPFRPDGILNGADLWDKIIVEEPNDSVHYPWNGLNEMLLGCRKGEIVTLCAGTGIGKSAVALEILHHFHKAHNEVLGVLALESSVKKTSRQLMGLELNRRIVRGFDGVPDADVRRAYESTVGSGRVFLYDHWGSTDSDNLIAKLRYMVRGCGCTTVLLDHISIVVSGIEDGDERRIIDNTMTRLRTLCEEVRCRLILVSHLKRPEGKGHEDGAQTSLSQLRGSAAIGQLSDIVLGLERNQQDKENACLTTVRILKNRFTGETGVACCLRYDKETGRLSESSPFEEQQPSGESFTDETPGEF